MTKVGRQRGVAARVGMALLNVPGPGLGLLRLGRWRDAAGWFAAYLGLPGFLAAAAALAPTPGFRSLVAAVAVFGVAILAVLVVTIARTWRLSRGVAAPRPWWARWWAVAGALAVVLLSPLDPAGWVHRSYKPYFVTSVSNEPTLMMDDRLIVDMRRKDSPRIGDMVLVRGPDGAAWLKRVAALGGQRFAMRDGVPIIDGVAAAQGPGRPGPDGASRLTERLPGDERTHEVLDRGAGALDDVPELLVPPDRLVVLGDNRDNSADSRVPRTSGGLGLVPRGDVIGRVMFIHWSADRTRIGTPLN